MLELFTLPFMQKALVAGAILGLLLPYLGVFVTLRRMSFFGDGIAHASLAGIAIGIATGMKPFWTALALAALFSLLIYWLERGARLATDAIIGIIFTTGLALGILIISTQPGYQPDLVSFLFGNILAVSVSDVVTIGALTVVIIAFLSYALERIALLSLNRDVAWLAGIPTTLLDMSFYVALAVSVVLGVKLLGIILVSALLIIPATTAKLTARSFRQLIGHSILIGEAAIAVGLILSYVFDLPSGAVIILTSTTLFALTLASTRGFRFIQQ
jgi:zinc transport system permease protein